MRSFFAQRLALSCPFSGTGAIFAGVNPFNPFSSTERLFPATSLACLCQAFHMRAAKGATRKDCKTKTSSKASKAADSMIKDWPSKDRKGAKTPSKQKKHELKPPTKASLRSQKPSTQSQQSHQEKKGRHNASNAIARPKADAKGFSEGDKPHNIDNFLNQGLNMNSDMTRDAGKITRRAAICPLYTTVKDQSTLLNTLMCFNLPALVLDQARRQQKLMKNRKLDDDAALVPRGSGASDGGRLMLPPAIHPYAIDFFPFAHQPVPGRGTEGATDLQKEAYVPSPRSCYVYHQVCLLNALRHMHHRTPGDMMKRKSTTKVGSDEPSVVGGDKSDYYYSRRHVLALDSAGPHKTSEAGFPEVSHFAASSLLPVTGSLARYRLELQAWRILASIEQYESNIYLNSENASPRGAVEFGSPSPDTSGEGALDVAGNTIVLNPRTAGGDDLALLSNRMLLIFINCWSYFSRYWSLGREGPHESEKLTKFNERQQIMLMQVLCPGNAFASPEGNKSAPDSYIYSTKADWLPPNELEAELNKNKLSMIEAMSQDMGSPGESKPPGSTGLIRNLGTASIMGSDARLTNPFYLILNDKDEIPVSVDAGSRCLGEIMQRAVFQSNYSSRHGNIDDDPFDESVVPDDIGDDNASFTQFGTDQDNDDEPSNSEITGAEMAMADDDAAGATTGAARDRERHWQRAKSRKRHHPEERIFDNRMNNGARQLNASEKPRSDVLDEVFDI